MSRVKAATCHPEKKVLARGLCNACYLRKWRAGELEGHPKRGAQQPTPEQKRRSHVKQKYGLDWDEYERLVEHYGGVCPICLEEKELVVDHDHETGKVRGLLCRNCNVGLGQLGDTLSSLTRAAQYLEGAAGAAEMHQVPPGAKAMVAVDFDATVKPWNGGMMTFNKPLPGAAEAVRKLKAAGFTVFIFTSRLSSYWHAAEGWNSVEATAKQVEFIRKYCEKYDIPADFVTSEKVPSLAYFDDRAIRVSGTRSLSEAVDWFIRSYEAAA